MGSRVYARVWGVLGGGWKGAGAAARGSGDGDR